MSANTVSGGQRGRNEAYRCSRAKRRAGCTASRIGRRKLETAVFDTLQNYILLPDILEEMFAIEARSIDHVETRKETQLKSLHAEKKKLASQIANLTRAIADKGHSEALLDRLTELESQRAQLNTEIRELEALHIVKSPPLTREQIVALSTTMQEKLTLSLPDQVRTILLSFIHEIRVRKNDQGQLEGTITYYLPTTTPPPNSRSPHLGEDGRGSPPPPDSPGTGYNLPITQAPLGAHLYRQTFTHPIVCQTKRPR